MKQLPLEIGSFGEEVKELQRNLAKHGFTLPVSELERGFFGPGTRNAVLWLQRVHRLPETGIVDERTKSTLCAGPVSSSSQPAGSGRSHDLGSTLPAVSTPLQSSMPAVTTRTTAIPGAPREIFAPEVRRIFVQARDRARRKTTRDVTVNNRVVPVRYPFPSPTDWRDCWMYYVMIDRFANPQAPPSGAWNRRFDYRQGGTFVGVISQLNYLEELGVKALWLSPVLKNPRPNWQFNYHGYDTQDFLNIDERFGSDGTLPTAERELAELIAQAHARGIFVILDIVLNHAGRVFDYVYHGQVVDIFDDPNVMNAPVGEEPSIQWLNGYGVPQADWQDQIPRGTRLSPDDAVYPLDLQEKIFFRRRGDIISYAPPPNGFVMGDFGQQRQLVVEFDASVGNEADFRNKYGRRPVLRILTHAYQYLIAKYDFDGFRIDTAKHVAPGAIESFGDAIREFAQTLGKRNFFTFGEIYDTEDAIDRFVGRHCPRRSGFGIDAALDYPLFFKVPDIVKCMRDVAELPGVYERRKDIEGTLISSHGDAGQYFVTFLDNHDQTQRFNHPAARPEQVTMGLALLFCLQGIPAIYYGTEQGLTGTVDKDGNPDLQNQQSVREALWGKPDAFDKKNPFYIHIAALSRLRQEQAALRFGRLYFRQSSANGRDFGYSSGYGGLVAFSRVVSDLEVLVVANTNMEVAFDGLILQALDVNRPPRRMLVVYSNLGATGSATVRQISDGRFFAGGQQTGAGDISALPVGLAPMEVKVWVPEEPLSF